MANLGYVGLGVMGSEMVKQLLESGHTVTGYNRTKSKAQWLIDKGMKWADSPRGGYPSLGRDLLHGVQFICTRGDRKWTERYLAGMAPGKIYIDMDTVGPATSRAVADKMREKGGDISMLRYRAVSPRCNSESSPSWFAGRRETFERAKALLTEIGPTRVTYVGDNGLALVMKIATNLSLACRCSLFPKVFC